MSRTAMKPRHRFVAAEVPVVCGVASAVLPARPALETLSFIGGPALDHEHEVEGSEDAANHPVIAILANRHHSKSKPGHRGDPHKVCLVIEGGGMRGCVSGGMVAALHDLGLRDAFDVVYGSSAGAINGAYFLAGQPEGSQIYVQDLPNNTKFIDVKRLFFGQPAMSLEYLVNEFLQSRENARSLKWEAVLDCPIPLKAVASSLARQQPVTLHANASKDDLFASLRATAQVPILAGAPFKWNDDEWVDGALFEPIPYHSAVSDNCTHVLALLTRPPKAELRDGTGDPFKLWWARRFIPRYLERLYQKGHVYTDEHYERDIELIKRHTADPHGASREPLPDHALHLEGRLPFGSSSGRADEVANVSAEPAPAPAPRRCTHLRCGADLSEESCGRKAFLYGVLPPDRLGTVSNMEMDARRLVEGVAAGYEAITATFAKALSAHHHHGGHAPHRRHGHHHPHAHAHGHAHPVATAAAAKRKEKPSAKEVAMMKRFAKSGLADIIK